MKELVYRQTKKVEEVRYRRPDNDPDVKEWEAHIARTPHSRYYIRTVEERRLKK